MLPPIEVMIQVPKEEPCAARVDMLHTLGPADRPAARYLLPGQFRMFTLHSGMTLRVSPCLVEHAEHAQKEQKREGHD